MGFLNSFSNVLKRSSRAFIVALIVSFSIWILINLSKTYQKTIPVKVIYTNSNNNTLIQSKDSILKVKIEGSGFSLLRKNINHLSYTISTKSAKQWVWDANDDQFKSLFPKTINVLSVSPKLVNFELIKLSQKKVPIRNKINVKTKIGYSITKTQISKDSVIVYGPKVSLKTINFIDTKSYTYNDLIDNINDSISLLSPKDDVKLEFTNVKYSYAIERFTQGNFLMDVSIKNIPQGKKIKIFPKQVNLQFQTPLSTYSKLNKEQFAVYVDYLEINSTSSLPIRIDYVPECVKNTKLLKNSVTYLLIEQ